MLIAFISLNSDFLAFPVKSPKKLRVIENFSKSFFWRDQEASESYAKLKKHGPWFIYFHDEIAFL